MSNRSVGLIKFITLIFALALLFYLKRESNEEKNKQYLFKEVIEKPISQIQKALDPKFVQMVDGDINNSR